MCRTYLNSVPKCFFIELLKLHQIAFINSNIMKDVVVPVVKLLTVVHSVNALVK